MAKQKKKKSQQQKPGLSRKQRERLVAHKYLFKRIGLAVRVVETPAKRANTIASVLVRASSRDVLSKLGIRLLDVSAQPELVHTVGKLVANRAVLMAHDYVATVSPRGGGLGRVGVGGIIDSIGQTGIEVEISPSGEVSTTVNSATTKRSKKRKATKAAEAAAEADTGGEVVAVAGSPGGDDDDDNNTQIDVGHKAVIKSNDGTTTIVIENLNVYMTILNVEDMVVGAKQVNYQVARRSKKIQAAIEAKEPDEVIDETEDTDAKSKEDQKKSKRKKKKGKNDDEKNDK